MLSVKNLNVHLVEKKKKLEVLSNINFSLKQGDILGIAGESGCGKSMLAHALMRLTPPSFHIKGEIFFEKKDLTLLKEKEMRKIRGKQIAMIFQNPLNAFNPVMSVGQQILESLFAHTKISVIEAKKQALKILKEVELNDPQRIFHSFPHELSGGMLQRTMIAAALITSPKLLIADEPTTALDVSTQQEVLLLLKRLTIEKKMGLILISHDLKIIESIADTLCVMYCGQIIEQGKPKDIFSFAAHPYSQALIQAFPSAQCPRGSLPQIDGSVPDLREPISGCYFHPRCPEKMHICKRLAPPVFQLKRQNTACWLYDSELEFKLNEKDSITCE